MRKLDWFNRVDFIDVLSTNECPIQRNELLARFHSQSSDGQLLSGAAAFAQLWRSLPLLRPLERVGKNSIRSSSVRAYIFKFLVIRPKLQAILKIKERRG